MKKLTKILAALLACITVFSTVSMAADSIPAEEATTTVQEETTTAVQEETTTAVQEETTTEKTEETTTEAQEETTTEVQEETTAEPTTVPETTKPEEETTNEAENETTAPTDEITTTTPEVTEPDVTEPTDPTKPTEPDVTDPTDPTQPEITAPAVPSNMRATFNEGGVQSIIEWDAAENADGYTFYKLLSEDKWKTVKDLTDTSFETTGHRYNSNYTYAVSAYTLVDGEKLYSDEKAVVSVTTPTTPPKAEFTVENTGDGVKITYTQGDAINGFRIYIKSGSEWKVIRSVASSKNIGQTHTFVYNELTDGKTYTFAVRTYSTGTKGAKWSPRATRKITFEDATKTVITSKEATSSSVTLKWKEIEGVSGYRVYVYKNNKWSYKTGIKTNTYKVTGLEAATKYKFKIRPYFKTDGKTKWGTYSDEVSVTTKGNTVKSYRVGKLKKYFTDGDWSVKVTGIKDEDYGTLDYTIAMKGNKVFVRYDFKNNKLIRDFEYLIDIDKDKIYIIFDDDKTYAELKGDEAYVIAFSMGALAGTLDMSTAKNVTAKTTTYSGKKAVAEIYTDKQRDIKKTYYFINDKVKALKIAYPDGSTETLKISKINDTPSSSVFKVPSNYKQIKY